MPTRKIADLPQQGPCRHREHQPAKHVVREPGIYQHFCPGCGLAQIFVVPEGPTL